MPPNPLTAKCLRYIIITAIILLLFKIKRANLMKYYYVAIEENLYGKNRHYSNKRALSVYTSSG